MKQYLIKDNPPPINVAIIFYKKEWIEQNISPDGTMVGCSTPFGNYEIVRIHDGCIIHVYSKNGDTVPTHWMHLPKFKL